MMHTFFIGVPTPQPKTFAKEFIIDIDDKGSAYINSLITTINSYTDVDFKKTSDIKYGDSLLFANNEVNILDNFTDHFQYLKGTKRIGIVASYDDAIDHVKNYFKNVYVAPKKTRYNYDCIVCPLSGYSTLKPEPKEVTVFDLLNGILNSKTVSKSSDKIYDGDRISVKEKVTILNNFVKVGYETYSIHNIRGGQYVVIGDNTYEVNREFFGKDYLKKV